MTSNPGLLRIGVFNTRSVRNKLHYIAETFNELDLDILRSTETWLFPSDIDIVRAALPKSDMLSPPVTISHLTLRSDDDSYRLHEPRAVGGVSGHLQKGHLYTLPHGCIMDCQPL